MKIKPGMYIRCGEDGRAYVVNHGQRKNFRGRFDEKTFREFAQKVASKLRLSLIKTMSSDGEINPMAYRFRRHLRIDGQERMCLERMCMHTRDILGFSCRFVDQRRARQHPPLCHSER